MPCYERIPTWPSVTAVGKPPKGLSLSYPTDGNCFRVGFVGWIAARETSVDGLSSVFKYTELTKNTCWHFFYPAVGHGVDAFQIPTRFGQRKPRRRSRLHATCAAEFHVRALISRGIYYYRQRVNPQVCFSQYTRAFPPTSLFVFLLFHFSSFVCLVLFVIIIYGRQRCVCVSYRRDPRKTDTRTQRALVVRVRFSPSTAPPRRIYY